MLATLNSRQIVDEIVKDTMKDNDPHDAVQISPDIIRASRASSEAPTLAPEFTTRLVPKFAPEPRIHPEPKISPVPGPQAAPSFDTAVRVAASDDHRHKRSSAGKWLRGAFVTFLFAGGSAAATIAWEQHGDTATRMATRMLAEWTPTLTSLLPSTSQTAAAQATPPVTQDQTTDQTAASPAAQVTVAAPPAATQADPAPSVESMTRDMAAMAQQVEQLKADIAELKAGQEQMVREMAKPAAPKPVTEARPPVDPRARVSTLPPRAPASMPPVRKPKPVAAHTTRPAYSPAPLAAPPPLQAAAVPPPVAPPVATTQAIADDDGPIVRPPMPLH